MRQHITKGLVSCALILCILFLCTTACSSGNENNLPSLKNAQKIHAGMGYFEAVEILGTHAKRAGGGGLYYVQWMLDNGQALIAILKTYSNNEPVLEFVEITDNPFSITGEDPVLTHMKVFHTIQEYNAYASGDDLLYEGVSSENYVYASALQCFGEFERYYYSPGSGVRRYTYIFTDANDIEIEVDILQDQEAIKLDEDVPVLDSVPKDAEDMRNLDIDTSSAYYERNGLLYCYKKGKLSSITWVDNHVRFTLFGSLSDYPTDGADTIVKRMLSVSEQTAEDAWNELKTYIRENNKKPIDWEPIMLGTGAAVLVVGIGVTAWIVVHKKRKRAAVEQSVAVPEPISEE